MLKFISRFNRHRRPHILNSLLATYLGISFKRITFKLLLFIYKIVNGLVSSYLETLIADYTPARNMRSNSKGLLMVPRSTSVTYGNSAFSIAAPDSGMLFLPTLET